MARRLVAWQNTGWSIQRRRAQQGRMATDAARRHAARSAVKLRPARLQDVPQLQRWDDEPHVAAACGTDGNMRWERDIQAHHPWQVILVAEVDERPIAVVVVIDPAREETRYWGDIESGLRALDIWIGEHDCLGQGYGSDIMRQVLRRCFQDGCHAVLVDPLVSNTRACRFYRRLGFREVGKRWFAKDHCLVHRLDRADFERVLATSPSK